MKLKGEPDAEVVKGIAHLRRVERGPGLTSERVTIVDDLPASCSPRGEETRSARSDWTSRQLAVQLDIERGNLRGKAEQIVAQMVGASNLLASRYRRR